MACMDVSAGYPIHAVKEYRGWTNPHKVPFTDWAAHCGATGRDTGHVLKTAYHARKLELCKVCWPQGHQTYHGKPTNLDPDVKVQVRR